MRLAADATGSGRLPTPDGTATVHNPLCGDRITVDVSLDNGKITNIAHEAKACVICQASASLMAEKAIGLAPEQVNGVVEALDNLLSPKDPQTPLKWQELSYFSPVKEHKSRHRCVKLPLEALQAAIKSVTV